MTKLEAINAIIQDIRAERTTKASLKRIQRAARILGLSPIETLHLERNLDYREADGGYYPHLQ